MRPGSPLLALSDAVSSFFSFLFFVFLLLVSFFFFFFFFCKLLETAPVLLFCSLSSAATVFRDPNAAPPSLQKVKRGFYAPGDEGPQDQILH